MNRSDQTKPFPTTHKSHQIRVWYLAIKHSDCSVLLWATLFCCLRTETNTVVYLHQHSVHRTNSERSGTDSSINIYVYTVSLCWDSQRPDLLWSTCKQTNTHRRPPPAKVREMPGMRARSLQCGAEQTMSRLSRKPQQLLGKRNCGELCDLEIQILFITEFPERFY